MSRRTDYEIVGADRHWNRVIVASPPGILEEVTFGQEPDAEFLVYEPTISQLVPMPMDDALGYLSGAAPALDKPPDLGTFANTKSCLAFIRERRMALAN